MTTQRLREYYASTYANESDTTEDIPLVPLRVRYPRDRYEAACAFLPDRLPPAADVLEMGAGSGTVAHSLLTAGVDVATYTLGDISQPRLDGLSRRLRGDKFQFIYADADEITKGASAKYDAVVMIALIEHLIDPMRSMTAIRNVLKPGGFVYIDTPNIAKWTRRAKLAFGQFPSTASTNEGLTTYSGEPSDLYDEGHLHYFTYRSLELMLTQWCGFARVERVGYYPDSRFESVGRRLAQRRPTLFSELACFAYA